MTDVEQCEAAYSKQEPGKKERGTVSLVVVRRGGGHDCPERGEITVAQGLVGDTWSSDSDPERLAQITLIMRSVVLAITAGKALDLPGDNIHVDVDLSDRAFFVEADGGAPQMRVALTAVGAALRINAGVEAFGILPLLRFGLQRARSAHPQHADAGCTQCLAQFFFEIQR